jgi:hypothetical protein
MKVYCPNCGQANETGPGTRVMCTACTAVFDAPADAGSGAGAAAPPPPSPAPAPQAGQSWSSPPPAAAPPAQSWQTSQPYPGSTFPTASGAVGQKTNVLAIVSLVSGIVCCIPVVSPAVAIITGVMAIKQIDANPAGEKGKGLAIAGLILGGLSGVMWILSLIGQVLQPR